MRQSQSLHFLRRKAHNQRFTRTNFVVANSAAVLFQHPDAVFLALVHLLDSILLFQRFQVQTRKTLVRTVIGRTHETVELVVIHIRQPLLKFGRLFVQPIRKTVTDFINLGVGKLYRLAVPYLDVIAVFILSDTLADVRHGVQKGVFQQVDTVVFPVLPLYGILVGDFGVLFLTFDRILVDALRIGNRNIRPEQVLEVGGVDTRRNPAFTEIEIQFVKRNRSGHGIPECRQRFFHLRFTLVSFIVRRPTEDFFHLVTHVSGDEAVFNLIVVHERIEKDASFQ